jgi:hypothetical protein
MERNPTLRPLAEQEMDMWLINDLLAKPATLSGASKYTAMNGVLYLCAGALLVAWPGATQKIFMDRAFVGDEAGLVRVMGLTVVVIGWLYLFGGRSDARQIVAASVVDRLLFVPVVLGPLAIAGVFPHLLGTFAILDPALGIGAWVIAAYRSGVGQSR